MKTWHLITVIADAEAGELLSSLLFDLGATGIVTVDETPGRVTLGAYYPQDADPKVIISAIENVFEATGNLGALHRFKASTLPDEDWMQKWKEGFDSIKIGQRLLVSPSWKLASAVNPFDQPELDLGRIVVQIDPGMAFGTGTHETTRMCLEALERHWRGGRLLDVGTGTGILGIAAAKLAPGSVITMIDIDAEAIAVAAENAAINGVSHSVEIRCGEVRDQQLGAFDLVVANLTAEVIIDSMEDLAGCLQPGGRLVLSGILNYLAEEVERALARSALKIIDRIAAGEWVAIVGQKVFQ
jgi:ribosomal protein L11 methyltransferase